MRVMASQATEIVPIGGPAISVPTGMFVLMHPWPPPQWKWKLLSHVWLFANPWTIQSMEFSRAEDWSRLSFLQGILPTQGSNPYLPHCMKICYQLRQKGSPRILEWVASLFSWPRNQTGVSCFAGGFFTNWTMREAQVNYPLTKIIL